MHFCRRWTPAERDGPLLAHRGWPIMAWEESNPIWEQTAISPPSLCQLTWTSSHTYPPPERFLAALSANKWPKAHVQEQTQNNAHGVAPPDAFQPKIASQQLTGSSGHLLHLQLGGTQHDFWEESLLRQDPFHLSLDIYCLQRSELARVPFRGKQALPEGMSSHPGLDEGQTKQPGKNSCFHWLKKGSQLPALR